MLNTRALHPHRSVFGLTTLFVVLRSLFPDVPAAFVPNLLVGFGFGASFREWW